MILVEVALVTVWVAVVMIVVIDANSVYPELHTETGDVYLKCIGTTTIRKHCPTPGFLICKLDEFVAALSAHHL